MQFYSAQKKEPSALSVAQLAKLKFHRPLWAHQTEAVLRFCSEKDWALLHEMGTGKTTTAITLLRLAYANHGRLLNTLIVTPKATIQNWKDEFDRASSEHVSKHVVPLIGMTGKQKVAAINGDGYIYILNGESLDSGAVVKALKEFKPQAVIVDECHRFKNPKGVRFEALLGIADRSLINGIMTGTPVLNSPLDLWAQFRILDGGATLGGNFYSFRERFFEDKNANWKGKPNYFPDWQARKGSAHELARLISGKSSRVMKSECLSLPPQVFTRREVELSPPQRKAYNEMLDELIAEVESGACTASNALTKTLRLLQITCGFLLTEGGEVHEFAGNEREELLRELLAELTPTHKVIVWAVYRQSYAAIEKILEELKIPFRRLYGGVTNVAQEISDFQKDPSVRVIVANPQAGGVGVTLTAASYSIYHSRNFSLGDRLQSLARNHRGGSEVHTSITVIDIAARDTIDADVLSALERKEEFSEKILTRIKELSRARKS